MKFAKIIHLLTVLMNLNETFAKSRFLKIEECSTSNKTLNINLCEIVNGKFNIKYAVTTPITQAQTDILFHWMSGRASKQPLKVPPIDLCSFLSNDDKYLNPIVKPFIKSVKSIIADVIKPCPYSGSFSLMGISADAKVLNWLPRGNLRFVIKLSNNKDSNILKVAVIVLLEK